MGCKPTSIKVSKKGETGAELVCEYEGTGCTVLFTYNFNVYGNGVQKTKGNKQILTFTEWQVSAEDMKQSPMRCTTSKEGSTDEMITASASEFSNLSAVEGPNYLMYAIVALVIVLVVAFMYKRSRDKQARNESSEHTNGEQV